MNEAKNKSEIVRVTLLAAAGAAALFLSACNTVDGAGEDLQESSENVKDAIND